MLSQPAVAKTDQKKFPRTNIRSMNIIVNGGSRGIGREVALYLAGDRNNKIIVTGRNIEALKKLPMQFSNIHPEVMDLSSSSEISEGFRDKVLAHFDRVDILINIAGALVAKDFMMTSEPEARRMMEINFFGPSFLIRSVKPLMDKGAHIVNISSMGGFQGSMKFRGLSYYSASKAAIACLTECLAEEFREYGISVNCIALGAVQTEMLSEAFPGYNAPLEASDIAPFIAYLALNGHKFMNGKIIPVALDNP